MGVGNQRAYAPAPVASLSKAITGLCFSRLVDAGLTDYSTTIGSVLGESLQRASQSTDPPLIVDPQIPEITFSQLLTHRSGLVAGAPLPINEQDFNPAMRSPLEEQVRRVLAQPITALAGTQFLYGNSNYQILALAIEAITGQTYENNCVDRIFSPLGFANAYIGRSFLYAARSGAGGWFLSAQGYACFADQLAPNSPTMGPPTKAWLLDRKTDEPAYGLGSVSGDVSNGIRAISHNGTLKHSDVSASSAFVKWSNGWTIAINLRPNRNNVLQKLLDDFDTVAVRLLWFVCPWRLTCAARTSTLPFEIAYLRGMK